MPPRDLPIAHSAAEWRTLLETEIWAFHRLEIDGAMLLQQVARALEDMTTLERLVSPDAVPHEDR